MKYQVKYSPLFSISSTRINNLL